MMVSKLTQPHELTRSQAREVAVQVIYQLTDPIQDSSMTDAIAFALESGHFPDEGYQTEPNGFLVTLLNGVMDHLDEIDARIAPYLQNWTIDRIARIDAAILRLATFELFLASPAVPPKVAVNEAVELTKFFSNDSSRKFVNGVLNQMLKQLHQSSDDPEKDIES